MHPSILWGSYIFKNCHIQQLKARTEFVRINEDIYKLSFVISKRIKVVSVQILTWKTNTSQLKNYATYKPHTQI
jgi:hypothetical protein